MLSLSDWNLYVNKLHINSEQSGESWNKYIRAYKSGTSAKARQMSIKLNTRDIYCRLSMRTHPVIAGKKRFLKCKKCERYGHTVRSCKSDAVIVETEENLLIKNCFE